MWLNKEVLETLMNWFFIYPSIELYSVYLKYLIIKTIYILGRN